MNKFWIHKPSELFKFEIFPSSDMTDVQKLNALTRLIIVISIILFIVYYDSPYWWKFLLCGLLITTLLYFSIKNRDESKTYSHNFICEPNVEQSFSEIPIPVATCCSNCRKKPLTKPMLKYKKL
jgi:hypothetical protein